MLNAFVSILTEQQWRAFVLRLPSAGAEETIGRRDEDRYQTFGDPAEIVFHGPGGEPVVREARILNVSPSGIMLKTQFELSESTLALIRLTLADPAVVVAARARHSTLTIGGYKTGFELVFGETDIEPPHS